MLLSNEDESKHVFIDACTKGDLVKVKKMVKNGIDVTVYDSAGVRWASEEGHVEMVKYLIYEGVDITCNENFALGLAVERGHLEVAKCLINKGAYIADDHNYAINHALVAARYEMTHYLASVVLNEMKKYTLLLLLNRNKVVNKDLIKFITRYLIKYTDQYKYYQSFPCDGEYTLGENENFLHFECRKYMLTNVRPFTPNIDFVKACKRNQLSKAKRLYKNHDLSIVLFGPDALYGASEGGHLRIIKFLISIGVNISLSVGTIALAKAAGKGNIHVIKFFIDRGFPLNGRNNAIITEAASSGQLKVIKYLASKGVDLMANDNRALTQAVNYGHFKVARYLIENGADVAASKNGCIRAAARYNDLKMVKYFVAKGAEVTAIDNEMLISRGTHLKMAKYLIGIVLEQRNKYLMMLLLNKGIINKDLINCIIVLTIKYKEHFQIYQKYQICMEYR